MPNVQLMVSLSDTELAELTSVTVTTATGSSTFPLNAFESADFSFVSSAPAGVKGYCVAYQGPDGGPAAVPGPQPDNTDPPTRDGG